MHNLFTSISTSSPCASSFDASYAPFSTWPSSSNSKEFFLDAHSSSLPLTSPGQLNKHVYWVQLKVPGLDEQC